MTHHKSFLHLFTLALLAISCNYQNKTKEAKELTIPIVAHEQVSDTTHITHKYIGDIIEYKAPILSRKSFSTKFITEPSGYDPNVVDTILTLSSRNNEFTYYVSGSKLAENNATVMSFSINSPDIYLPKGIHTTMKKPQFISKLSLKPFDGVLLLSEEEGYQKLYFTFKDDSLVRIQFDSDYLD